MIYTGIDIVEFSQIKNSLNMQNKRFIRKIFTENEIEQCESSQYRIKSFAENFAVKEAVMKAIETGWMNGVGWKQIELIKAPQKELKFSGKVKEILKEIHIKNISFTITSTQFFSTALIIMTERKT